MPDEVYPLGAVTQIPANGSVARISLSPDLGISSDDFLEAWNEDAETRNLFEAYPMSSAGKAFDPTLIAGVLFRDFRRGRDDATVVVVRQDQTVRERPPS